jgi:hypothetical protein
MSKRELHPIISRAEDEVKQDRREEYYERTAKLIARFPLWFYWRAKRGLEIQTAIKPKDYETPETVEEREARRPCTPPLNNVSPFDYYKRTKR